MFGRLFGKKKKKQQERDEAAAAAWYEAKSAFLETVLGKEHDMVGHSVIPYYLGGALDLYYYPNVPGVAGVGIATKELTEEPGQEPSNRAYPAYELVMFTRHPLDLDQANDPDTPFGRAHQNMNAILNAMARYCGQATLNPHDTCEFPEDFDGIGGKCLILDAYSPLAESKQTGVGLMLVMEVHRSEMDFARSHSGGELIEKLKAAGRYPYSDLDREAVV